MDLLQIEHRGRTCELGYLHRSEGSCLYSLGETVVLAAVNGPGDLRASKQLPEKALVETYFHTKVGGSMATTSEDAAEKRRVERHLQTICESYLLTKQFPRATIVVTLQEMHNDGCLLSSSINATCLSLLDAGLPMRTVFAAVTCILATAGDGHSEVLLVEPTLKQERNDVRARMIFLFESSGVIQSAGSAIMEPSLAFSSMDGIIAQEQLKSAQELARKTSEDVFQLYRNVIEKRFSVV